MPNTLPFEWVRATVMMSSKAVGQMVLEEGLEL